MNPLEWWIDGIAARLGARFGRKLASAPPGHVGCAFRQVEPVRSRWRNGLIVVDGAEITFRSRHSVVGLDRATLTFDDPRAPSWRDRVRLVEGDRVYRARTAEGRLVEIAVGRGRATIMAALESSGPDL